MPDIRLQGKRRQVTRAVEGAIRREAAKLHVLHPYVTDCRVTLAENEVRLAGGIRERPAAPCARTLKRG